uniref:Uncharacterized protein n=1 Tax=Arcella intermedia TaxID=1963864 RepID=A0A6B2LQD8_9EUKA
MPSMNFALNRTPFLHFSTCAIASKTVIPQHFARYATKNAGEREMPPWQCTNTGPFPISPAKNPTAASKCSSMHSSSLSCICTFQYAKRPGNWHTPAPMLRMALMPTLSRRGRLLAVWMLPR